MSLGERGRSRGSEDGSRRSGARRIDSSRPRPGVRYGCHFGMRWLAEAVQLAVRCEAEGRTKTLDTDVTIEVMTRYTSGGRGPRLSFLVAALAVAVSAVALACAVVYLPQMIVRLDAAGGELSGEEYISAIADTRTLLLQALGGLTLIVGAYAAWRRLVLDAQELRVLHEGQLTDRFIRAIEQLGHDSVDVRVGGIFALARVARNSPADADAVIATLSSFVRRRASWPPESPDRFPPDTSSDEVWSLAARAPDIQVALATLGQLPHSLEGEWIRLQNTDLRSARMSEYNLDYALVSDANLQNCRAWNVSLVGADLRRCDLRDAELRGADLRGACLYGADLRGAELDGAALDGAEADESTLWPTDFDWSSRGVVVVTDTNWRSQPPGSRLLKLRSRPIRTRSAVGHQ